MNKNWMDELCSTHWERKLLKHFA